MRDLERIDEFLDEFKLIWKRNSDLRLAQLILNCGDDLYYMEDEDLLKLIKQTYKIK